MMAPGMFELRAITTSPDVRTPHRFVSANPESGQRVSHTQIHGFQTLTSATAEVQGFSLITGATALIVQLR